MRRNLTRVAIALAIAAVVLLVLLPPASIETAAPPSNVVRGAYHIHTDRSDGSGSPDEVAAAAARAGLQFIILTDHGDGTQPPDAPAYRHGVLTLDAVELNTTGGHYVAIGLPPAPYPLAGTPDAVSEDVKRLGGLGIAAHPGSPRPSLRWKDWDAAIDGLEWINGDSEWRDETRLPITRALMSYLFRAPESMAALLDRPSAVLDEWDRLTASRRVFAIAGIDAHASLGLGRGTDPDGGAAHLPIPGYEATFRTFSNHVALDTPWSGDAGQDAAALIDALRKGRLYSVIDALASPGGLSMTAASGSRTAMIGDDLAVEGDVQVRASVIAPPGTRIALMKNGERVHEVTDGALEMNGGRDVAVYRVEAYLRNGPGDPPVPWIVSNPIYAGYTRGHLPMQETRGKERAASGRPAAPVAPAFRIPARSGEATAEFGRGDTSALGPPPADPLARRIAGAAPLAWMFALSPGIPRGQFAAVQVPVTGGLAAFDRVRFTATSPRPLRAWVQLRAPVGNTERWGTTFYADAEERIIDVPLRSFMPIGVTSSEQPPLERVTSLLFVVDTLNFLPGTSGSMVLSEIAFVR
jgi:hypothetical protein